MADRPAHEVIFVYNADGGALSRALDAVHKFVRPQTYQCSLCKVTHGALAMRREWKEFIERLPMTARALHRDEFAGEFPGCTFSWPAVLVRRGEALEVLIGPAELAEMDTVPVLSEEILARLATPPQPQDTRSIA